MGEKNILRVLGQSHALEILASLDEKPMRFTDLKEVCKSNRTRSAKLKESEKEKLLKLCQKLGSRAYTFYEITPLGKQALELCRSLLYLESSSKG